MSSGIQSMKTLPVSLVHTSEAHCNGAAPATVDPAPFSSPSVVSSLSNVMRPLFHFTADDAVILAMEHNNHNKLLAVSTSNNEVFVTSTRDMPLEGMQAANGEETQWSPAENTVRIDHLRFPCTQLAWAPWQYGIYLACVCRGKQVRLYRLSHGRWSLDEEVEAQDCNSVAFSAHFTMACVTAEGKLLIFVQTTVNGDNRWMLHSTHSDEESPNATRQLIDRSRTVKAFTCVAWDETGTLLAVGDDEGELRVVFVYDEGRSIGEVAYRSELVSDRRKGIRQVAWSPGAGRSFLVLAVVTSYKVTLLFFKRARVGMSGGGGSGSGAQAALGAQLHFVTKTSVNMEEVTELSWNIHGGRFATAHTGGAICVWAVNISYQKGQQDSFVDVENVTGGNISGSGGANHVNVTQPSHDLVLVASVSKVSGVHPYHGDR
ncbi:hypothetical protein TraAM80_01099 [Trypanosoma rangeli]|uniref:Uncharacterized protein n=1 Tax=Trypanosoma rangeli TaxID=5698 RepID=A0A3R7N181_TRYRA|nr:uncharacterized protein TraAM80_01099 [Trypanosoma rangeli]RNF11168.1 hypothetical protein TraAM80_01099 [Trypanosoma rangeli]|eukprot:RNF11168.1 hypothetical protein TraAM80_01099 [Trypanosoma rangeli]